MATNITQTTLSAAMSNTALVLNVASATGISAPSGGFMQQIYVIDPNGYKGELMNVTSVNGTQIGVSRLDQFRAPHASGAIVLIAPQDPTLGGFREYNPSGAWGVAGTYPPFPVTVPWVNIVTGEQWLQGLLGEWVPGWNNPSATRGPTAAVASAAGVILPSGPLFHVTGALAVTGFTMPVGFTGGYFTIIPDGAFTWTAAGNIALAGSAVVSKSLEFTWDANAAKWYPSYIA